MQNNFEKIATLRKYYDKLIHILQNEAEIKMFGKAIFNKKRIDDAMCCIDANMPDELVNFQKKFGDVDRNIKTFKMYKQLIASIKNKPPIGTSSYMVNVEAALNILERLKRTIEHDITYIEYSHPDL